MSCRITGKICDAWSEFDGCGLVCCKFMEKKDGGEILNGETVTDRHQMTNADRIRAMSDEEMAGFIMKLMGHAQCFAEGMFPYHPCPQDQNCKQCGLEWLQQPAEEDDHA